MRKIALSLIAALAALAATAALAHGGKTHQLLGTVQELRDDRLVVKSVNGEERSVVLTATTRFEKAGKPALRADLVAGVRVSIRFAEDDEAAVLIKISAPKP